VVLGKVGLGEEVWTQAEEAFRWWRIRNGYPRSQGLNKGEAEMVEYWLWIDQVWGKIGLDLAFPLLKLSISQQVFELEVRMPRLELTPDRVELSVDYRACWSDLKIYGPLEFGHVHAAQAKEAVLEAIAQTAAEGDRLAAVEAGEMDAFSEIAQEKALEERVEVGLVPLHLPEISFQVIRGEKRFESGGVESEFCPGQVKGELSWGRVGVFWLEEPDIHIRAVRRRVDVVV